MKKIQKYQAEDGREFFDKKECEDYEVLCAKTIVIMSQLPSKPDDEYCRFSNGHGFIQHDEAVVAKVKNELLDLIGTKIEHKWIEQSRSGSAHPSYVGRLLDDYGIRPLSTAWSRLYCIDKYFREWGQPYYAINPDEGEQFDVRTEKN
jgi:hypothetical protein